jgi:hypothetical protein
MSRTKRHPLTGEVEHQEDPYGGASLNGAQAPEGSAERVRESTAAAEDEAGPIMVNTYDAEGEAIAVPATVAATAPELPGFDAPALEQWPRFEGRRVGEVVLAFAGQCDLPSGIVYALGKRIGLSVGGVITSIKHASKDAFGPVRAVVAVSVDSCEQEEAGDNAEYLDRLQAVLTVLDEFREAIGDSATVAVLGVTGLTALATSYIEQLVQLANGGREEDSVEPAPPMAERIHLSREDRRQDEERLEHAARMAGMGDGPDAGDTPVGGMRAEALQSAELER